MKIPYEHFLRFLPKTISMEDISNSLFQLGHEHEIIDNVFDIEFTPNRGDCLSLLGLSRELNIFYDTNFNINLYHAEIDSFDFNFINNATNKCSDISFLSIEIDKEISEYKDYIQSYFDDLHIKKNNFFSDITNYVAYELGQPTHSYDLKKINLKKPLILDETSEPTNFRTLLETNINIEKSELVFFNDDKLINLAGVMGGLDTCCDKDTRVALIECAYFKPDAIIGKAVKYNLNSEASYKFERGVDPLCHEMILRRIINIVSEHTNIKKIQIYRGMSKSFKKKELPIDIQRVNRVLGLSLDEKRYQESLIPLGFKFNKKITIPSYRNDIFHQNDLAEELARVIGYDNIPASSISIPTIKSDDDISAIEKNAKAFLIDNGFFEVINQPFSYPNNQNSFQLDNPLDSNKPFLRTNILDSLVDNVIYNENRQQDSIKLFEIADIYFNDDELKKEKRIAIMASGRIGKNYDEFRRKIDSKYLNNIITSITDINIESKIISRDGLNSKIKSQILGVEFKISDLSKQILEYAPIKNSSNEFIKYDPISEYPSTYRDLSYLIKDSSKIYDLQEQILNFVDKDIKEIFIFDYYNNQKEGHIKLGIRFIFQSCNKTLKDSDVDKIMNIIIQKSLSITGVSIPGI